MILLYHLIFPDDTPADAWNAGKIIRLTEFKKQISFISKLYKICTVEEHIQLTHKMQNRSIAITFDDGYRRTFDLVGPYLTTERIPATFFTTTSHLENGQLLWFVYFNALCFEKAYPEIRIDGSIFPLSDEKSCFEAWRILTNLARASGSAIEFARKYANEYPLPESINQKYLGLTEEQISQIGKSNHLSLGGHTVSHPYLDQLSYSQQLVEIQNNKITLEEISRKGIRMFAYTGGIYNRDTMEVVQKAGFKSAFTINPLNLGTNRFFELPRTDIYYSSILLLALKILGVNRITRKVGITMRNR